MVQDLLSTRSTARGPVYDVLQNSKKYSRKPRPPTVEAVLQPSRLRGYEEGHCAKTWRLSFEGGGTGFLVLSAFFSPMLSASTNRLCIRLLLVKDNGPRIRVAPVVSELELCLYSTGPQSQPYTAINFQAS